MLTDSSALHPWATEEAAETEVLLLATGQGVHSAWNLSACMEGLLCLPAASSCTSCVKAVLRLFTIALQEGLTYRS